MDEEGCARRVIGAAIEVHRELGPGLLESAYEGALARQLELDGLAVLRQPLLPVTYKGVELTNAYRIDLLVADAVVVEVKAVDELGAIHRAQLLTYLRLSGKRIGLLLNFNETAMRRGIKRIVNR